MRISGIKLDEADPRARAIFEAQAQRWGGPLLNHLIYARIPAIFKAVRGMWGGLDASGLLPATLVALVNRRVATLNHCPF
ncbi:MAG: hypothetical protein AAF633_14400 [Chloroflexota bacterium]